ncbi:2,3-bisphosphoglycerate-dependent phosphoglycerate mutase [Amnibacterium sp.]|uniref:2,3-bisphosphoglycerate-dependent phosphoglycerate mutase n=1 Tax=Amnibacterium sp. TaxID=1872496 RepID=UPI003F7B6FA5
MTPGTLVLLRHGESTGNRDRIFTGMLDVPLTERGRIEGRRAGELLRAAGIDPDLILTSAMRRARETVDALGGTHPTPVVDARLNERNYGALTGRTKQEVREAEGEARFLQWRRSYAVAPPPMTAGQRAALLPRSAPGSAELGLTKSLHDVVDRVARLVDEPLRPLLAAGRCVLVVAHGNSLRALCMILDRLSPSAVAALNLPTGFPLQYRLDDDLRPLIPGGTYLAPAAAALAAERIRQEGGT